MNEHDIDAFIASWCSDHLRDALNERPDGGALWLTSCVDAAEDAPKDADSSLIVALGSAAGAAIMVAQSEGMTPKSLSMTDALGLLANLCEEARIQHAIEAADPGPDQHAHEWVYAFTILGNIAGTVVYGQTVGQQVAAFS